MENFIFLKNDYPDLYLLCSDVAKYIETDNSISMLKARQAIEFIVKYLGAETDDLFVNINNLEDKSIANSRIIELFHFIRKKANKSVHNEINADTDGVLDALIEICVWLAVGRDKKNISIIKFTDKEKFFFKKYGDYKVNSLEESFVTVDAINPLEIVGKFSDDELETTDVLEQDVFETYDEYCKRIESLPAIKIGYAFMDSSQIDDYCEIAFPLFHISKHPKIESTPVAAFYVSDISKSKNIDGIIKAKLKIFEEKIYYDYGSVTLQDEDSVINLFPIIWEKYGYETEEQFEERIRRLPLLPVGIAKPIRKEYDLKKQILPFETIPMAYVSNVFAQKKIFTLLNRDYAKEVCLIQSPFKIYGRLNKLQKNIELQLFNKEKKIIIIVDEDKTIIKRYDLAMFELNLSLAKQGNTGAQCKLASFYEYGYGVEENDQEAIKWYVTAAKTGNAAAQCKLADCYDEGIGIERDENKAFEWYKKAAEQGYAEAQHSLAVYYYHGNGTEEDKFKAFEWYKRAAEQGYVPAQGEVAECYGEGIGIRKDNQKATEWKKQLADTLASKSMLVNDETAWIMKIAKEGNVKAQYKLAEFYYDLLYYECSVDTEVLNSLEAETLKWYKKAAEKGYAKAQYGLADCYYQGIGTEEDEQQAFKWYKKAAENGYPEAQYELARCYEYGIGTEKGEQKAFEWYRKAAENGYDLSQYEMAQRYGNGQGIERNEQKAFEWYKKAAENGYGRAQFNLAKRYEIGLGAEKDEERAFEWYKKAAEKGNYEAQYELVERYEKGKGTERNEQKAFEWCIKAAQYYHKAEDKLLDFPDWTIGTDQDSIIAFEVCKIIADRGSVRHQYKLATCYANGIGTRKNEQQAFEWFKRAAENGYIDAQCALALCYENGIGTDKDKQQAVKWYKEVKNQGSTIAKERIERCNKVLMGNKKFSIAVTGEFSSGKSTFVNALLGKVILPAGRTPTTTIISKINYGESPAYTIRYRDDKTKQISDIDFLGIKAQSVSNLYDGSEIKYVDIEYPATFCKNNVEVIDSPGTNDLSVGRLEFNYYYLKKADAVVLILVAGQALSESEKEFLRERYRNDEIRKFFIVLNKKDELDECAEENQLRQHMVNSLNELGLGDFSKRVFLVSGKQALLYRRKESGETLPLLAKLHNMVPSTIEETGLPEFEKELMIFISEKRSNITSIDLETKTTKTAFESSLSSIHDTTDILIPKIVELTPDNYDKQVLYSDKPVLVYFYNSYRRSEDSYKLQSSLKSIAQNHPHIKVCKLNVGRYELFVSKLRLSIGKLPVTIAFKNGKKVKFVYGEQQESYLLSMVE